MFKKAKLYSLLAIVVTSTMVGLFQISPPALAQNQPGIVDEETGQVGSDGLARWSLNGTEVNKNAINYNGHIYTKVNIPDAEYLDNKYLKKTDGTCNNTPTEDNIFFKDIPAALYVSNEYTVKSGVAGVADIYQLVIYFDQDPSNATGRITAHYAIFGGGCANTTKDILLDTDPKAASVDDTDKNADADGGLKPEDVGAPSATGDNKDKDSLSKCQIKGIGWIVCPALYFLAAITDESYKVLDNTLLRLEPMALPGSDNDSGIELYKSWKTIRDFANIIFIIGFMIIVFSQITSIGITNYGIKRLLPKIIIAAILVNISYYVCVIAVDLSNILGNSMRDMFAAVPTEQTCQGAVEKPFCFTMTLSRESGEQGTFGSWEDLVYLVIGGAGITAAVVGVGGLLFAFLPVLLPVIVSAAVAVFTVVVALTLRQALVVILVVISPLAFVALLLPNTEDYFKKWRSLFTSMLLIYPIVSIVFGGSQLASRILMATDDFPIQLIGAGVSVIPLFITPILLKISGGLLNRWVGVVNDPSKGWVDSKRNALKEQGAIIAADRKGRGITRTGNFVSGTRASRLLGGANSRRRRALAFGTGYGERVRKDELKTAESDIESAYLGTAGGLAASNASKNAQIRVQTAELSADSIRLATPEGIALQRDTTEAQTRKQIAETRAQTAAISALPAALAAQEKQSEIGKHVAETRSQTAAISAIPSALEAQAKLADVNKKAAEDRSEAHALSSLSGSAAGQAALTNAKEAELRKQVAETGNSAYQAGQTIDNSALRDLTKEVQQNQAAAGVAQGVTTRRFNKDMADGTTVDIPSALGITSTNPSYGEVTKAVDAAKTEAAEKEVKREQLALQERVAQRAAAGDTIDTILSDELTRVSDNYERSSVYNEMARRGRDGLIIKEQSRASLTPSESAMLQEAIQSNGDKLVGKSPHLVKGKQIYENINGGQVAGFSKHGHIAMLEHINSLPAAAARRAADRYNKAMLDASTNPDTKEKFDQDAGEWALEYAKGIDPRTGRPHTSPISAATLAMIRDGLNKIDPTTGGLI